jgi:hypothetical protein
VRSRSKFEMIITIDNNEDAWTERWQTDGQKKR